MQSINLKTVIKRGKKQIASIGPEIFYELIEGEIETLINSYVYEKTLNRIKILQTNFAPNMEIISKNIIPILYDSLAVKKEKAISRVNTILRENHFEQYSEEDNIEFFVNDEMIASGKILEYQVLNILESKIESKIDALHEILVNSHNDLIHFNAKKIFNELSPVKEVW